MSGRASFLSVAWKVVAGLALLGALVLVGGLLLPGTWEATRTIHIDAPPEDVRPWIETLERWDAWTFWGEVEAEASGPPSGAGATRSWDEPFHGQGTFTLTEATPRRIAYRVEVEGGAMVTRGTLTLDPEDGGTRVTWTELGDFGWNPLMGYAALTMGRVQGTELRRSLQRLQAIVQGEPIPDSLSVAPAGSGL